MVDAAGNSIPSQLIPLTDADRKLRDKYVNLHAGVSAGTAPKFFLVFAAAVPPLGYTSFVVRPSSNSSKSKPSTATCNSKAYDSSICLWTRPELKRVRMISSLACTPGREDLTTLYLLNFV